MCNLANDSVLPLTCVNCRHTFCTDPCASCPCATHWRHSPFQQRGRLQSWCCCLLCQGIARQRKQTCLRNVLQRGYNLKLRCQPHMGVCSADLSLSSVTQTLKEAAAVGSPSQHEQAAAGCEAFWQLVGHLSKTALNSFLHPSHWGSSD